MGTIMPSGQGQSPFDAIMQTDAEGEYWCGRDLSVMMQYTEWRNFAEVISKARDALALVQGEAAAQDHFVAINRMVPLGSGAQRSVPDYRLTRFAAYLVAMAGDDTKEAVAHARIYFAVRTGKRKLQRHRPLPSPRLSNPASPSS